MKRRREEIEERRKLKLLKNEEEMKKYSVIRKANSLKCLDEEVFKKNFQSLPSELIVHNKIYKNIDKELVSKLYEVCKENMEDMYNACDWKWNEKKEIAAFRSRFSRFIIIFGEDQSIAAYLQMQFIVDEDDETPVVYIYDIQVNKKWQKHGLGGRLMKCAEDIALSCGIPFCRLTVFKHNPNAFEMYTKKFNYFIDPVSPSQNQKEISFFMTNSNPSFI